MLCGDFNTPRAERVEGVITFGHKRDGQWRMRPTAPRLFTAERPFNPVAWDAGERAVLQGIPQQCGVPDTFRRAHPDAFESTWVPKGKPEDMGRCLDHIFASAELDVVACEHLHAWRRGEPPLSDHWAVEAVVGM